MAQIKKILVDIFKFSLIVLFYLIIRSNIYKKVIYSPIRDLHTKSNSDCAIVSFHAAREGNLPMIKNLQHIGCLNVEMALLKEDNLLLLLNCQKLNSN